MTQRLVWSVVMVLGALTGVAEAQTCRGTAALTQQRSFQAGLAMQTTDGFFGSARTVAGSFLVGDPTVFAVGHVGRTTIGDINGTSTTVGVLAGVQVPSDTDGRFSLCPTFEFLVERGPKNANGTGIDLSNILAIGGAHVGFVVVRTAAFRLVPSLAVGLAGARYDFNQEGAVTESANDRYAMARLAVGLVVGRVNIVPSVFMPFKADAAERQVRVDVTFSFGR